MKARHYLACHYGRSWTRVTMRRVSKTVRRRRLTPQGGAMLMREWSVSARGRAGGVGRLVRYQRNAEFLQNRVDRLLAAVQDGINFSAQRAIVAAHAHRNIEN